MVYPDYDDSFSTARYLGNITGFTPIFGELGEKALLSNARDSVDYIRFTLQNGGNFTAKIDKSLPTGNYAFQTLIYDAQQRIVAGGLNGETISRSLDAGDYYIKVIFSYSNDFTPFGKRYALSLTSPSSTTTYDIYGAIKDKWLELGGAAGFLGNPTTDETGTPDGVGRYNHFEGGSIYWTPHTGAHTIYGDIFGKWSELGYENGFLGYPTTDETGTPDGVGRYNHFEGGSIYWTPHTGAHLVSGELLIGTNEDDTLAGHNDNDYLLGFEGHDVIYGSAGDDTLRGGSGNDLLSGGFGFDSLDGGSGIDTVTYDFFSGDVNANLATEVVTFPGNSTRTDETITKVENLIGARGNDSLVGNSADNRLDGNLGGDTLIGGSGADSFVFDRLPILQEVDTIEDFDFSEGDKIEISANFGGGITVGVLDESQFTIGSSASNTNHRLVYNDRTGGLFFDADGVGGEEQIQFAILSDGLTSEDIFVI